MTKILFDIQRDNGYGKNVYLKGSLSWMPIQNSTTNPKPNMSFELGFGPIEFNVEHTDKTFLWAVSENLLTSGGTSLRYERIVSVPESADVINYLDLEDVDPNTLFTGQESITTETIVEETTPVVETPVVETPVVETPVVETPVVETPVEETPVVETPVVETPVEETTPTTVEVTE